LFIKKTPANLEFAREKGGFLCEYTSHKYEIPSKLNGLKGKRCLDIVTTQ